MSGSTFLLATVLSVGCGPLLGDTLNIAVASNFVAAMKRIEEVFESSSGHEITIIRGSSGKHYAQIVNGAPFDVFLSADQERPRRLVQEGIALEATLSTYAQGQLALWSRDTELNLGTQYLINTDGYRHIAIANPRLAPYGQAAEEVFISLGIESQVIGKLVMGENIAQAFQFAFSGNADLGLIAYSQALSPEMRGRGTFWLVPGELHQPIRQDMVILRDSVAAAEFGSFMKSEAVRRILAANGYLIAEDTP